LGSLTPRPIELEAAEAKELQTQSLVSASPAADRFKCGPDEITGWRPWFKNYAAPTHDWVGRGGLDVFDDCMVRISRIGFGATQLCPGLILSVGDSPIYLPFGLVRASASGYQCEDDAQPIGRFRIYLDELAATPTEEVTP
jgi:hypothetical protein